MRRQGTVMRAFGGFYYVLVESGFLTCKPRGKLRLEKDEILVGDRVEVSAVDDDTGIIEQVFDRKTVLSRPKIANVDLTVVVIAAKNPDPSTLLVDRYLALVAHHGLEAVLCINKADLVDESAIQSLFDIYRSAGYDVFVTAAIYGHGIDELRQRLSETTSVLAGPSGVGKSVIFKALCPEAEAKIGEVSRRTGRGRHTTRHAQLVHVEGGGLVADSPGFSYLRLDGISSSDLRLLYQEFRLYMQQCKFKSCLHRAEPECAVKEAVESGRIHRERYENYLKLLSEIELDQG